jgi:cell division septum initiation protein DivIVA
MDEDDDQTTGSQADPEEPPRRQDAMNAASNRQDMMTTVTERIQVIIDAAEKAAAGIIEDAEAQARRYLDESRQRADQMAAERARAISDLTDSLISQAETVKRQSDDLISALDDAKGEIASRVEPQIEIALATLRATDLPEQQEPQLQAVESPPAEPEAPTVAEAAAPPRLQSAPPVEQAEPPHPAPEPGAASADRKAAVQGPIPASAKLLATQMAVAGSSRDEIEKRLRSEYGIEDAASMLDAILGPGA